LDSVTRAAARSLNGDRNRKQMSRKLVLLKTKQSRPSRLPPGQRLLKYMALSFILLILQSYYRPVSNENEPQYVKTYVVNISPPFVLAHSMDDLRERMEKASAVKNLRTGVFVVDPKLSRYVDLGGRMQFPAASLIKLPIYASLMAAIDRGSVRLDQMLEIKADLITGGSGWLQWRQPGSKISVKEAAELMMIISDNTATNLIIDLLGGKDSLNRDFASWGLTQTRVNNMLGDFAGTNKTSPYDLVLLLTRIDRRELISEEMREWMYQVMERTRVRTLLPYGLAPGAKIAHKTGDIGMMVGDAGIVTTPEGNRFFVAIQVERPHNDRRANLLIRALSKAVYECFSHDSANCTGPAIELERPQVVRSAHRRGHRHGHHRGRAKRRHR
jgi:beta-lactamase class A